MGPTAEKVCQQLVANGRLDFYGIVDHIIAQEQDQAQGEEKPSAEQLGETCATAVMKLLQRRFIEQVRKSTSSFEHRPRTLYYNIFNKNTSSNLSIKESG